MAFGYDVAIRGGSVMGLSLVPLRVQALAVIPTACKTTFEFEIPQLARTVKDGAIDCLFTEYLFNA